MFPLSSNISGFSFNKREHLFDWGLHALIGFFTAHVTFVLDFPTFKFQCSTDSFVFTFTDVEWSFMVCASFFKCVFTNSFIIFGLVILFVRLYYRYIRMFFRKEFPFKGQGFLLIQLHFRASWFTGLFNIFLLCVLIFDLMLGIHE